MYGTEGFDLWWLIPVVLIGLCFFWVRGCCSGRRDRLEERPERNSDSAQEILSRRYARGEIDDEEYEGKRKTITGDERRDKMTTEKEGQKNEREEKCAVMDGCSPQRFAKMMARYGENMNRECGAMMQEMMKGGCCQPEEK